MGNRVTRPRDVTAYDIGGRFRVRLAGGRRALASRVRDGDRLRATLHFMVPALASAPAAKDYFRVDSDVDFWGEFGLDIDAASLKGVTCHASGRARVDRAWNVAVPLVIRVPRESRGPFLPDVTASVATSVFWASDHAPVRLRGVTFERIHTP